MPLRCALTARRLFGQTELLGGAHVAEHGMLVRVQPREAVEVVLALLAGAKAGRSTWACAFGGAHGVGWGAGDGGG